MFRQLKAALAFSLGLLSLLSMWSCNLAPEEKGQDIPFTVDSTWTEFERLEALQINDSGRIIGTLYQGEVLPPGQVYHLNAEDYPGVNFVLLRGYLDGTLVFEQKLSNDPEVGIHILSTQIWLLSVKAESDTMILHLGGEDSLASASVRPLMAGPKVKWTLAPDPVVSLNVAPDFLASSVRIKPLKLGETVVTLTHPLDTTKTASMLVRVVPALVNSVSLTADSLRLFVGGPAASLSATVAPKEADSSLQWKSLDSAIAKVDSKGTVSPVKAGSTLIIVTSPATSKADTAKVQVVLDAPILNVTTRKLPPSNSEVEYQVKASQEFGTLESFKWDLNGDGIWDDSLHGPWSGTEKNFEALKGTYLKEGDVNARFSVRDGEGNITQTQVTVSIGNQAPRILALRGDTVVSIKDSIPFFSTVADSDGTVAQVAWDFDGDGKIDDSLANAGSSLTSTLGHGYAQAGTYKAVLRVKDNWGKSTSDTVKVTVLLDAPAVAIGADTTVMAGTRINISMKGTDGYGHIVKRELKVGDGPFVALSNKDTSFLAPLQAGNLLCLGRVTDDDGLSATDTLVVTVTAIPAPKFLLTAHAGPGGTLSPDSVVVDSGHAVTFNMVPDSGYRVDSLFVNGTLISTGATAVGNSFAYSIPAVSKNFSLRATFRRYFKVTVLKGANGSVSGPGPFVDSGSTAAFIAKPDSGYRVEMMRVNGSPVGKSEYSVGISASFVDSIVTSDIDFVATFALPRYYQIKGIAGIGGTVSPSDTMVGAGNSVIINIVPNKGDYRVDSVFVNGNLVSVKLVGRGISQIHTINPVDRDVVIRATFRRFFSVVYPMPSPDGSVTPDSLLVDSAGTRSFTITPAPGKAVASLNNGSTSLLEMYPRELNKPAEIKISEIKSDVNLVATFAVGVTLKFASDPTLMETFNGVLVGPKIYLSYNGRIDTAYSFERVLPVGMAVTVRVDPTYAFESCLKSPRVPPPRCAFSPFRYWSVDGKSITSSPAFPFTVTTKPVTVMAFYEIL